MSSLTINKFAIKDKNLGIQEGNLNVKDGHTLISGKVCTGKTRAMMKLIDQAIEKNQKFIVFDYKSELIEKYYNADNDHILDYDTLIAIFSNVWRPEELIYQTKLLGFNNSDVRVGLLKDHSTNLLRKYDLRNDPLQSNAFIYAILSHAFKNTNTWDLDADLQNLINNIKSNINEAFANWESYLNYLNGVSGNIFIKWHMGEDRKHFFAFIMDMLFNYFLNNSTKFKYMFLDELSSLGKLDCLGSLLVCERPLNPDLKIIITWQYLDHLEELYGKDFVNYFSNRIDCDVSKSVHVSRRVNHDTH